MTDGEEDFATMFEASVKAKRFKRGQTIEGTIVAIGPEVALVNVGGKGEAQIEVGELKDHDGALEVAVGDRIQATVVSTEGGLTLSRKLARGAATSRQLEDAYRAGLAVEGKVEGEVKGGYEVRVAGQRGFCPFSQIDTVRATDTAQHIASIAFDHRVHDGGKNSWSAAGVARRRAEGACSGAAPPIVPGAVMTDAWRRSATSRVRRTRSGVQGLLHVSEMAWSRVSTRRSCRRPARKLPSRCAWTTTRRRFRWVKQLGVDP